MEYKELRQSIKDMEDSKLSSLEIEFPDGTKISMKKNTNNGGNTCAGIEVTNDSVVSIPSVVENVREEAPLPATPKTEANLENCQIVKSPMVGTFYTSSAPDKPEFVKVGDKVKKGDTLCIIEAMKLMNQIESEFDGEIVEICVQNEGMVEYGMPLFKIK
ncbi:MAG: acetyl-CoA carboxylase biotin carboxyl carrier protein [Oscillospiraceae bacterium]|nr:acetyl-CoA carboxylase biotin carboxyl carrier protein [Oscillospiraceae bacterium]